MYKRANLSNLTFTLVLLVTNSASRTLQDVTAHLLLQISLMSSRYFLVVSLEVGACRRGQCQQASNDAQLPEEPCVFLCLVFISLMKTLIS